MATNDPVVPVRDRPAGPCAARAGAIAGGGLLGIGAVLTAGIVCSARVRAAVQDVDDRWYGLVQRHRSLPLSSASRVLDIALGTTVDWTIRLAVTAMLARQRRWRAFASWATTIALGEVSIGPLKGRIERPRPAQPIVTTTMTSYPSGHAIAAATTCPGLALALLPPGRRRDRGLDAAVAVAAATALSRTYLNAHWLSDVIAGFCLGTGYSLLAPRIIDSIASTVPGR